MNTDALGGMRVVDVAREASGSYCARLLADFGADVVKLEDSSDGGDPTRRDGAPVTAHADASGDSARFVYLNQNKRSVALDLKSERGRELARRLVLSADVIVDQGASGGLAQIGLTFADIQQANPKAVVVSITPFGQGGPYADRPACHLTIAALSGWLKVRPSDPEREPIDIGFPLLDFVSASVAAVGAVAVWRATRSGGEGQLVDVSQQEVSVRMYLYPTIAARLGLLSKRQRPFPMYVMASNGYAAVNALNATHYRDACLFMGLIEEAEAANPTRGDRAAVEEMQKKMDAWAAGMTREEIFEIGQAMRIPAGIPYTLLEVAKEDAFHQRNFFRPLETKAGVVQQPVGPIAHAVRADWKDAPSLGENTDQVIEQWLEKDAATSIPRPA